MTSVSPCTTTHVDHHHHHHADDDDDAAALVRKVFPVTGRPPCGPDVYHLTEAVESRALVHGDLLNGLFERDRVRQSTHAARYQRAHVALMLRGERMKRRSQRPIEGRQLTWSIVECGDQPRAYITVQLPLFCNFAHRYYLEYAKSHSLAELELLCRQHGLVFTQQPS